MSWTNNLDSRWKRILVGPDASVLATMTAINATNLQIALVTDLQGRLIGTVTDGDVRRGLLAGVSLDAPVQIVMNASPFAIDASSDRETRLALMRRRHFHHLPIVDAEGRVVGLETIDDLIQPKARNNWILLMAGGMGKRMRPLTDTRPKPLLEVGGRPIIETTIRQFVEQGFKNFYLSVFYKAEMFREHFGDGSAFGARIEYLQEDTPLGTAGGISLIKEPLELPLIVMNGDILTTVNLGRVLDFFEDRDASALMCVRDYELQVPYGVVQVEHGNFLAVEEKPMHRFFVNAGIYVVSPAVAKLVTPGEAINMTDLFEVARQTMKPPTVFPISEYWLDVGRSEDFVRANTEFSGHFKRP